MTTIVYPDPALSRAWAVAQYDEGVQWDVEITTSRNGRVYTQALPGARWKATLAWDADSVAHLTQRRQLEALLMSLRGGANRLQVWHLLTPQPLGTLRGLPVDRAVAALIPDTVFIHVKDARGNADRFEFLLPGEGGTDYVDYFRLVQAAGYIGALQVGQCGPQ